MLYNIIFYFIILYDIYISWIISHISCFDDGTYGTQLLILNPDCQMIKQKELSCCWLNPHILDVRWSRCLAVRCCMLLYVAIFQGYVC